MTDYLYDGTYNVLCVKYDAKNGNQFWLEDRQGRGIIHFWDEDKVIPNIFILGTATFKKEKVNNETHLTVIRAVLGLSKKCNSLILNKPLSIYYLKRHD